MPKPKPVFSDGRVHVMQEMCPTCIFRPGNQMGLQPGRVAEMVSAARSTEGGSITCHSTLYGQAPQEAVCRGFFDHHKTALLQMAERLGIVTDVIYDYREM